MKNRTAVVLALVAIFAITMMPTMAKTEECNPACKNAEFYRCIYGKITKKAGMEDVVEKVCLKSIKLTPVTECEYNIEVSSVGDDWNSFDGGVYVIKGKGSTCLNVQGWRCQPREGDTYPGGLSSGTTAGSFFGSGGLTESCTAKYPNLSVGERDSKCEADLLKEGKVYADYVVKIWQPKGEAVSKGEQNKEMVCQFLDPASNTIAAKFNYKFTGKKK